MSFHSPALADSIWRNGSLQEVFRDYPVDGRPACGLNPNIRVYKSGLILGIFLEMFFVQLYALGRMSDMLLEAVT